MKFNSLKKLTRTCLIFTTLVLIFPAKLTTAEDLNVKESYRLFLQSKYVDALALAEQYLERHPDEVSADAAKALFALKKANVPGSNLIAIVDPSVEYELNTLTNIVNISNNPRWEGIIETGIGSDMRFIRNIFGFDFYVSNYLPDANETIDSVTTTAGKANVFFSAASSDLLPFMGAMRQMPKVDAGYNMHKLREEYVTTARYGLKVFRPENLVVVLSDTDQV